MQISSDGALIAIHDATLTRTTNVETLFAPRDGGYSVSDFTLAEIKTLTALTGATAGYGYSGFTPSSPDPFRVPTLTEVIGLASGWNADRGADVGVYPEAKAASPELNRKIIEELAAGGFGDPGDKAIIQSFSFAALRDILSIQGALGTDIFQAALGAAVLDDEGVYGVFDFGVGASVPLTEITGFARGVGVTLRSPNLDADFIGAAHDLGLQVHGWTFITAEPVAASAQFQTCIDIGTDGFFANFPDLAVAAVAAGPSPIPLPAPIALLGAALVSLAGMARIRGHRAA